MNRFVLLCLLVVSVALAACSGAPAPAANPTTAPAANPTTAPESPTAEPSSAQPSTSGSADVSVTLTGDFELTLSGRGQVMCEDGLLDFIAFLGEGRTLMLGTDSAVVVNLPYVIDGTGMSQTYADYFSGAISAETAFNAESGSITYTQIAGAVGERFVGTFTFSAPNSAETQAVQAEGQFDIAVSDAIQLCE